MSSAGIQPVGFHIGISGDWVVTAMSANIADHIPAQATLLGAPLTALLAEATIHDIRNRMALLRGDDAIEHLFHCRLSASGDPFDISIYRDGDGFGIDAEISAGAGLGDTVGVIEGMLARLKSGGDIDSLCEAAARQIRSLTGYESVLVELGGAVRGRSTRSDAPFAETPPPTPQFMTCDTGATVVPVTAGGSRTASSIRSDLRALTPSELEWLAGCNARAALVLPLTIEGRVKGHLYGLHTTPRQVSLERRGITKIFASIVANRLEIVQLRGDRDGAT